MRFQVIPFLLVALAAMLPTHNAHAFMDGFDKMFTFRKDQKPLVKPTLLTAAPPKKHVIGMGYDTKAGAEWARYYTRDDLVATTYMDSSSLVMRPDQKRGYIPPVPKHDANMPTPAWPMPNEQYRRQPHPNYGYGYGPANIPAGYAAIAWRNYQNQVQQQRGNIYVGAPGTMPHQPNLAPSRVGVKTMVGNPVRTWNAQPQPIDYTSLARRGFQPQPVAIEQGEPTNQVYAENGRAQYAQPYQNSLPNQYVVQPGDTLSTISEQDQIYGNWKMWPLIYDANRGQLNDPDRLYPQQNLGIPRDYTVQQSQNAQRRATQKYPPHNMYDGL